GRGGRGVPPRPHLPGPPRDHRRRGALRAPLSPVPRCETVGYASGRPECSTAGRPAPRPAPAPPGCSRLAVRRHLVELSAAVTAEGGFAGEGAVAGDAPPPPPAAGGRAATGRMLPRCRPAPAAEGWTMAGRAPP